MKQIFKSLINNDTCIEGGRKRKWWIALLLLLFSMIVSLIPSFVTGMTSKGSANFTAGTAYGLDYAVEKFVEVADSNITMVVQEDKTLKIEGWAEGADNKITYIYLDQEIPSTIVAEGETAPLQPHGTFFFNIPECTYAEFLTLCDGYRNTVIFAKNTLYICCVKPYSTGSLKNAWSDAYTKFETGTDLVTLLKGETQVDTRNNLIYFLDSAYKTQKVKDTWIQTGIYAAVNLVVTLLFGLMIWILTRGKNNPFRIYTFWESMKISFWCSTAPAILTVPLGFLIRGTFGNLAFPLLLGLRVMWLTTKSLRPDYGQQQNNGNKK